MVCRNVSLRFNAPRAPYNLMSAITAMEAGFRRGVNDCVAGFCGTKVSEGERGGGKGEGGDNDDFDDADRRLEISDEGGDPVEYNDAFTDNLVGGDDSGIIDAVIIAFGTESGVGNFGNTVSDGGVVLSEADDVADFEVIDGGFTNDNDAVNFHKRLHGTGGSLVEFKIEEEAGVVVFITCTDEDEREDKHGSGEEKEEIAEEIFEFHDSNLDLRISGIILPFVRRAV